VVIAISGGCLILQDYHPLPTERIFSQGGIPTIQIIRQNFEYIDRREVIIVFGKT